MISISAAALLAACAHAPPDTAYDYEIRRGQVYAERSSGALAGDLYLPEADTPLPAVVMIHGGGWRRGEAEDMERFAKRLAGAGFAVFNIAYRLAPAHKFPAQLEDARQAVRWLRANAGGLGIDARRVGAWGFSAGAHLAMLLGTVSDQALADGGEDAPSARVSGVVAGAGPTDLRRYPENKYVADLMPEGAGEDLFALASPVASAGPGDAPTFLYHGRRDWIVDYSNSVRMRDALVDAGVDARLYDLSFGHFAAYLFADAAVDAGIGFLRQALGAPRRETAGTRTGDGRD